MKRHMCLNVRGYLKNSKYPKDYKGLFLHDDGREMTAHESREALLDELARGHVVIPMGDCDNFDFSGPGCRGHESNHLPDAGKMVGDEAEAVALSLAQGEQA